MARRGAWARMALFCFFALVTPGCLLGRVAFSPDGKRFAAVVEGDPDERADGAADGAAAAPKGEPPSELWVTDVATGKHARVARDGAVGVSSAWSADGKELWFFHGEKLGAMTLARWNGKAVTDVAPMPLAGDGAVFALVPPQLCPDGKSVLATETSEGNVARIVRCDAATGEKTVLAESAGGAVLSPKRDRFAFLAWDGAEPRPLKLCVMPLEGKPRVVVATLRDELKDLAGTPVVWSPDGAGIAWEDQPRETVAQADAHAIYLARVEAGAEKPAAARLSPVGEIGRLPLFAADGSCVFYTRWLAKDGPTVVRRVDLLTRAVTDVPGSEGCVAAGVSPDGRYLAMQRAIGTKGSPGKDATVVRLVEIATGAATDHWVSAYQLRVAAATSLLDAVGQMKAGRADEASAALVRADEALRLLATRFPGAEKHPAAARTRRDVDDLRAAK